jgi:hypothetical protein
MKIFELKVEHRPKYQNKIEALEQIAEYPLGTDFFKISHGLNYFQFFDRLGETHYYICEINNEIVAVACAVLRKTEIPLFYLCDLKVHPDYRGRHIPLKILFKGAIKNYLKCPRGYAISMNHPDQTENRIAKLLKKFWLLPFQVASKILIYSLSYDEVLKHRTLIEKEKGEIGFLSLVGVKDLILKSTQKPLPLMHIQYGKQKERSEPNPKENHTHMISLLERDSLIQKLTEVDIFPSSTATLISHNAKNFDWSFIRTSDI